MANAQMILGLFKPAFELIYKCRTKKMKKKLNKTNLIQISMQETMSIFDNCSFSDGQWFHLRFLPKSTCRVKTLNFFDE